MFAAEFEYKKVSSVSEAIQLLSSNEDAKILAGGHSLIPMMKQIGRASGRERV